MICIISAVSQNNVIGLNGKLPWNIREDMEFFKKTTMGSVVIFGRRTFEGIGKPLPGRKNIVISSHKINVDGVEVFYSLTKAVETHKDERIFICGGEQLYSEAISFADKLYITRVKKNSEGDTFFPEVKWELFESKTLFENEEISICEFVRK